ncbi:MAG: sigma-70 family RNA polymerase sigma factor [Verrucomicrobiae bacterium]|nr:sigma-70 family RNA polymerase sigma factor [Verrucomicrobiae bacterium]MCP5540925.1 sigma-70 family RNA polymerase sigma factor [Akkermansiaceae bacterium]
MSDAPTTTDASFPTTRWTIVRQASEDDWRTAKEALESLCADYLKPLRAYARSRGQSDADARDTVQEFLSRFVASGGFAKADKPEGRLRTFLLRSLRNFITDQWRRQQTARRTVERNAVSLDDSSLQEIADAAVDSDKASEAYDREWARFVMDKTLSRIRADYQSRDRLGLFEKILPLVEGRSVSEEERQSLCRELDLTSNAFGVAVHRLRNRLARTLREVIRDTVEDDADIEDELRYLGRVLRGEPE